MGTDVVANTFFGASVAVNYNGSTVVAGAEGEDDVVTNSGSAYVFHGFNWETETKLKAQVPLSGGYFGKKVAINNVGDIIVATEVRANGWGYANILHGVTWGTETKIQTPVTGVTNHFGWSADISGSGDIVVIGAHTGTGINSSSGLAYVFSGSNWSITTELSASDGTNGSNFGWSAVISSDETTIVIGAPGESTAIALSGAVYVYTSSNWSTETKIKAAIPTFSVNFGWAVAINANASNVFVGGWGSSPSVYILSGDSYADHDILATSASIGKKFGSALSCADSGAPLIVGAHIGDGEVVGSGLMYVYD